jgi:hypothetical protein
MSGEISCAKCGAPNPVGSSFCGECGERPTPPDAPAPTPTDEPTRERGSVLPWAIGGCFVGLGLAVLLAVGLIFTVMMDDPADRQTTTDRSGPGPETPSGEHSPAGSATGSEQERPEQYAYASTRSDCSQHAMLSDTVKDVGIGIDQQLRTVDTVPTEEEMQIGAEYVDQLADVLGGRLVKTGPLPDYLAGVARPMLAHVQRKDIEFHFYMLEDTDMENALALPGGYIVVTRPLFDSWATNEARLATVLGHEMAHVDGRHPIAVVQYSRALGLPDDDEVSQGLVYMAQMPYSSALEEESDRVGATYAHRAGYSVFQSVALWREQERLSEVPAGGTAAPTQSDDPLGALLEVAVGELEHLMSTHPNSGRRACLLEQKAYDLFQEEPRETVYVGNANLRNKTPMADRKY